MTASVACWSSVTGPTTRMTDLMHVVVTSTCQALTRVYALLTVEDVPQKDMPERTFEPDKMQVTYTKVDNEPWIVTNVVLTGRKVNFDGSVNRYSVVRTFGPEWVTELPLSYQSLITKHQPEEN